MQLYQWKIQRKWHEYKHDYLERVIDSITLLRAHEWVFRNFDRDVKTHQETRQISPMNQTGS